MLKKLRYLKPLCRLIYSFVRPCKYFFIDGLNMGERVILREGSSWVIPEKIHTLPTEEISAVRRGKEKIVSHNSKCILGHTEEVGG